MIAADGSRLAAEQRGAVSDLEDPCGPSVMLTCSTRSKPRRPMSYRTAIALALTATGCLSVASGRATTSAANADRLELVAHPLTSVQMRADVARLRFTLEHAHPALYRYTSRQVLDREFDLLSRRIERPMSDLEFYRTLAPLIALIRNSHTGIQPPADALRSVRANVSAFPFVLRFVQGRALVEANLSGDKTVQPGAEILLINGHTMAEVTHELMASRATEGFGDTAKYARLNQSFWQDFMLLYGASATYSVQVRNPSEPQPREHKVAGVPSQSLIAATKQFPSNGGPAQSLTIDRTHGIGVMRIANFLDDNTPAFFQKAFRDLSLSGVRNLIVDLRGNHGGVRLVQ